MKNIFPDFLAELSRRNVFRVAAIDEIVASEFILGWQWRLRDNLNFGTLRDRPAFKAILAKIKEKNSKARASLKASEGTKS